MSPARLVALAMLAAALVLPGCGGGNEDRPENSANILHVGNGAEPADLDPHLVTGVSEHLLLSSLFQGLVDVDLQTLQPIPGVAARWEVSDDGLTYTFHLREDARWSNGDPVTADHFVYSWRRMLTPALASQYSYLLHCIENARAFNEGDIEDFSLVGVRAEDDRTLVVTLDHPTPYFLTMQVHFAWYPVHPPTIERYGSISRRGTEWTRAGNFVGNGPFALAEWAPQEYVRTVRNPEYWNADGVALDGITFYPIANEQTEERSFRAGELHLTFRVPLQKIPRYREDQPEVLHLDPYLGTFFFRLNVTRPPFDDPRVRRAFGMAIDREALVRDILRGGEQPAYHYTPPNTAGYTAEARVTQDVEAARALLAEAGYPGGAGFPTVELLYNTSEENRIICEAVQQMWREGLGVDVRLLNQDWKVYLASMRELDYDIARSRWIGDVVDPINFLEMYLTGSGNNRTGYTDPEYDRLIRAAYAEADHGARLALLQQAEARLLEAAPVLPVNFLTNRYLQAEAVRGHHPNLLGLRRWQDLSLATE